MTCSVVVLAVYVEVLFGGRCGEAIRVYYKLNCRVGWYSVAVDARTQQRFVQCEYTVCIKAWDRPGICEGFAKGDVE